MTLTTQQQVYNALVKRFPHIKWYMHHRGTPIQGEYPHVHGIAFLVDTTTTYPVEDAASDINDRRRVLEQELSYLEDTQRNK